jgi:outer membrane immunogenic protein
MKMGRSLVLGIAGSVMIATGAMAADVPPLVVAAPPPPPVAAPAFDWGGLYVGAHGGGGLEVSCLYSDDGLLEQALPLADCVTGEFGGQVGYNVVNGNFLFGAEASIGVWWDGGPSPVHVALTARGGLLVGDNLLVYGEAGFWRYLAFSSTCPCAIFGLGAEYAISNSLSIFAEAKILTEEYWLQIGINWHLGN